MTQEENPQNRAKIPLSVLIEVLLLFCVFYLPSYLFPRASGNEFNQPIFHVQIWLTAIPQSGLIIYLVTRRTGSLKGIGLRKPGIGELLAIIPLVIGLFLCAAGSVALTRKVSELTDTGFWNLSNRRIIPLLVPTCLVTGYSEEFFFRGYLISSMEEAGAKAGTAAVLSSLLFTAGHGYEGGAGLLLAFLAGLLLSAGFVKTRNIHTIGIAHGLYNFITLVVFSVNI